MKENNGTNGAVLLIEAVIVFPVVFFVIFFIICLGNAYYTRSCMDNIASSYAAIAANYATNETIYETEKAGSFNLTGHDIDPYQYRVSQYLKDEMNKKVATAVKGGANTLIGSMAPYKITGYDGGDEFVHFDSGFFSSRVIVYIKYRISMIPFVRSYGIASVEYTSWAASPINDNVELIRNMDLVRDIVTDFSQTPLGKKTLGTVKGKFEDIKNKISKMFSFFKGDKKG